MRNRVQKVLTNQLEPPEDSSISLTCTVTLTLTESESSFSLFSSEWDNESVDWEGFATEVSFGCKDRGTEILAG